MMSCSKLNLHGQSCCCDRFSNIYGIRTGSDFIVLYKIDRNNGKIAQPLSYGTTAADIFVKFGLFWLCYWTSTPQDQFIEIKISKFTI